MKSICLVEQVKWKFTGNMNPHAFDFGDVDNDKDNEFVIGNLKGELSVFKGISVSGKPYLTCSGLGTITCVAVGDIKNSGKNSIVCVNAEGQCHIFDITSSDESAPVTRDEDKPTSSKESSDTQTPIMRPINNDSPKVIEKPTLTLPVPVNCNRILIADIDGDGINEIILARTDRALHVFNFQKQLPSADSTIRGPKEKQNANSLMPCLEEKKRWYFDGQVTSLSTAKDPNTSSPLLIVGQPGGNFVIIEKNEKETFLRTQMSVDQIDEEFTEVSTETVRGTRFKDGKRVDVVALITMDGKFTLYDLQSSSMSHHDLRAHKLFGMATMDLCIDDEKSSKNCDNVFVVCAWNGCTYVIDHDFNVVKFEFEERVCAFAAGQYAITPGHNVNCFLYVDFEDQITVYYNLRINTKPVTNFMEIMRGQFDKFDELLKDKIQDYDQEKEALSNGSYQSTPIITEFFHQCLYQLDDYKNMKVKLQQEIEELKRKKCEEKEEKEELVEENTLLEPVIDKEQNQNKQELVPTSEEQISTSNIVQDVETQEIENASIEDVGGDKDTDGDKAIQKLQLDTDSDKAIQELQLDTDGDKAIQELQLDTDGVKAIQELQLDTDSDTELIEINDEAFGEEI